GDALLQRLRLDQDLPDGLLELSRVHARPSPASRTAASRTFDLHIRMLDEAGDGDHLVPADHERPGLALGTGDLGVHEYVLDLLAATCEPVAGPPSSYLKPFGAGADPPDTPAHLARQVDRPALEPKTVVLADGHDAATEVDTARSGGRREEIRELGRHRGARVERAQDVRVRLRVKSAQERQDLVADEAPLRIGVRRVDAERHACGLTVRLRLPAPHVEKRMDDAVRAPRRNPGRGPARREPVHDRLHLVRRRVAGRTPAVARDGVALAPELRLAEAPSFYLDHAATEHRGAEIRIRFRLVAAELVIHVQCRDAIAEHAQHVPEAGRVRTARDE